MQVSTGKENAPGAATPGAGDNSAGTLLPVNSLPQNAQGVKKKSEFLDAALWYARKGWHVFPVHTPINGGCSCGDPECDDIGKHPRTPHGCSEATINEAQIRNWWTRWPNANIGWNLGKSGKLAIDIDPRKGGNETWDELKRRQGINDDTVHQLTGGNDHGKHFVYNENGCNPDDLKTTLGPGVDVKRGNAYIIVWPSVHRDGNTYEWGIGYHPEDMEPLDLPPSLLHILKKGDGSTPKQKTSTAAGSDIPDGRRNKTLASYAGAMRRKGMTEGEILAALLVVNEQRCKPPLDRAEVERIAKGITRYAPGDPALEEVPEIEIFTLADILADDMPLPPDVVEGFLPGEAAVLISGPGGDGKSYAMLDLAVCVARGTPWLGLNVIKTPVLILDLENKKALMRVRVQRVLNGHGLLDSPPAVSIAFDVGAMLDADDGAFEIVRQAEKVGAGLVVLDSLVDFLGEAEENSNPEMARVAERLRLIAERAGATILAVHHTPKAGNTPRGATALRNGVDVSIMVDRDGNTFKMRQDKNRMGPEQTVTARLNWAEGLFNLSPIGVSVGREKPPPDVDEAAIRDVLSGGEWMASNDIVAGAMERTGHARRTLQRKLKAMIDDLVLDQQEQGKGLPYLARLVKDDAERIPF